MAFPRRLRLLFILTSLVFGIIWLRMIQLQTVDREAFAAIAQRMRQRPRTLKPPRGRILDRRGAVLAWDAPIRQVAIVGAEWVARARRRCPTCGTIHFYDPERRFRVRRCSCRTPAAAFEEMRPPDLGELAAALGLETQELEALADGRVAKIERLAAELEEKLEKEGRAPFLLRDQVDQYESDLMHRPYVYPTGAGRVLAGVSDEAVRLIELDEVGQYRGFRVRTALRRRYDPEGPAGQMLGFVSAVSSAEELEDLREQYGENNIGFDTRIGRCGIEMTMNPYLVGENGSQLLARDEDGAFTVTVEETLPAPGMQVDLTLTKEACRKADAVLEHWGNARDYYPRSQPSGGMVVMRVDTGAIVAWGELPRLVVATDLQHLYDKAEALARYDLVLEQWFPPEDVRLQEGDTLEAFQGRLSKPAPRRLSRVSQIAVEPGSTMKVFVGLGLLDGVRHMPAGTVLPLETRGRYFSCDSLYTKSPGCHAHRDVDFIGALTVSCNKYFAWSLRDYPLYWKVFKQTLPPFLRQFGFGQPTGIDVAKESRGSFLRDWVDFDPRRAIAAVPGLLLEEGGIRLKLEGSDGLPDRVAGRGAERLVRALTEGIGGAARALGAQQALLRVRGGARRHPYRDLYFQLLLPPPVAATTQEETEAVAKAREDLFRKLGGLGAKEDVEVDTPPGTTAFGFRLTYHQPVGRDEAEKEAGARAPLLAEDARNLAIGQGPVTATPLQMVRAMAAVANGGTLVTPHVVAQADGRSFPLPSTTIPVPRQDLDKVRAGMRGAVYSPGGTAFGTALKSLPGTVYGKTGTAQPGGWWTPEPGPPKGVWHHWFVGFYEQPGRPTLAFACVLHARREAAAGLTSAKATHEFLTWWARHGWSE